MTNQTKPYKAYIAANPYSVAFDSAYGTTTGRAIGALKRKTGRDWVDCYIWVEQLQDNGEYAR